MLLRPPGEMLLRFRRITRAVFPWYPVKNPVRFDDNVVICQYNAP
ncbi:hypothetical protein [Citrobacter sp. ESBL3]